MADELRSQALKTQPRGSLTSQDCVAGIGYRMGPSTPRRSVQEMSKVDCKVAHVGLAVLARPQPPKLGTKANAQVFKLNK
eukprot:6447235-Amphidinium_carterae.1